MIVAENLTKIYRTPEGDITAVSKANLEIAKGEYITILGHSGGGKTTLLSLIGGLTRPTEGRLLIDGSDIWVLKDRDRSILRNKTIGFIFQFASLIPTLRVIENLMLPASFYGSTEGNTLKRAEELLSLVDMTDKIYAYPNQLSGGQQRRVAITRALMNDPEIILADEPTGDLDEETEAEMVGLFQRINKERDITFILVTHSSELAKKAGRRLRMDHGILIEI